MDLPPLYARSFCSVLRLESGVLEHLVANDRNAKYRIILFLLSSSILLERVLSMLDHAMRVI